MHIVLDRDSCRSDTRLIHHIARLLRAANVPSVQDIVPGSTSVLIAFHDSAVDPDEVENIIHDLLSRVESSFTNHSTPPLAVIPVCYDPEFAPDLPDIALASNLSAAEVVALHTGVEYDVLFLGFQPGFAYLTGLPASLHTPRLRTPRPHVEPGSVGIADDRTGIYPSASPGGWRLIGRTPLRMFDATRQPPALLDFGQRVRFVSISRAEFDSIMQSERFP